MNDLSSLGRALFDSFSPPFGHVSWLVPDTAGDRASYLASYLAARKPAKRQPDIYQAVFLLLWGSFETRLLMVHPSLGRLLGWQGRVGQLGVVCILYLSG